MPCRETLKNNVSADHREGDDADCPDVDVRDQERPELEWVAWKDAIRKPPHLGAGGEEHQPAQHARQPECDDDHGHGWRTDHAAQQQTLDEHSGYGGDGQCKDERDRKGQARRRQRPPGVGADHEQVALSEVDDVTGLVHEHQAERDKCVDAARGQTTDDLATEEQRLTQ